MNSWSKIGFVDGHGTSNSVRKYSFLDVSAVAGTYNYRLKQFDRDGNFEYSANVEAAIAPKTAMLEQNYPNPFNPTTVISYQLPVNSVVALKIYDVLGREVETLVAGMQSAGDHHVTFNGAALPSGVYFYRLQAGSFTGTKKLLLLK